MEYYDCDDGNLDNGDGCDQNCEVETGWRCSYGDDYNPDQCWKHTPYIIEYNITKDDQVFWFKLNHSIYFT